MRSAFRLSPMLIFCRLRCPPSFLRNKKQNWFLYTRLWGFLSQSITDILHYDFGHLSRFANACDPHTSRNNFPKIIPFLSTSLFLNTIQFLKNKELSTLYLNTTILDLFSRFIERMKHNLFIKDSLNKSFLAKLFFYLERIRVYEN